jgi:hypothetical protein
MGRLVRDQLELARQETGDKPFLRYAGVMSGPPDVADLCLIRMSDLNESLPVLSVNEKDFRVYRRNGRDVIPIVCPPRG